MLCRDELEGAFSTSSSDCVASVSGAMTRPSGAAMWGCGFARNASTRCFALCAAGAAVSGADVPQHGVR